MKIRLFMMLLMAISPLLAGEKVTRHTDRATPKLILDPDYQSSAKQREDIAQAYLRDNWDRLGLAPGAANLKQREVKHSLLGTHYYYAQYYQDIEVEGSEVIVSLDDNSGRIFRVMNTTWPEPVNKSRRLTSLELVEDEALEMAWQHMRVHVPQTLPPKAEKLWRVQDGKFTLIWRTELMLEAPMGGWEVAVDALSGKVLGTRELATPRKRHEAFDYLSYKGEIDDRISSNAVLRARMEEREARQQNSAKAGKRADGTGIVFDPDPRTTLLDDSLDNNSTAQDFQGAYFTRDLLDITQTNGVYSLSGPWVQIMDFESPLVAPTTTTDGNWDTLPYDQGFHDAMVYFHLDQNQRYIQSLGFTGERGIQSASIGADANGQGGGDQSRFYPGSNLLTFGHGCVPDTFDADVILHEYGHAIHFSINPRWNGGDTGAMGEGFGDYWAESYSYKTPNGPIFRPDRVFDFDASFDYNVPYCWGGRFLNKLNLRYDDRFFYGAHDPISGGESDELWSTPLFQSMLDLEDEGIPLTDCDTIVLEAQFGLGSGLRMPDLAAAIVQTAELLFPNGPHADVYRANFVRHNILAESGYTYYAAHVPPDNDWINEIQLVNTGSATATIEVTIMEAASGLSSYTASSTDQITLQAGASTSYNPAGSNQRWLKFQSDQPLAGTSFFSRMVDGRGEEKAGIPLFSGSDTGSSLIIPHIPADRNFFSAAVILNLSDAAQALDIDLIGENGNTLAILNGNAPTFLEANQKWVGFLAPGPNGLEGIFDDEAEGQEKVSYIKITGASELAAFQLFGYKADPGGTTPLATSGIKALPDQGLSTWPVRISLTGSSYSAFSILNPDFRTANLDVSVIDKSGSVVASTNVSIPARSKKLGLNFNDGNNAFFRFPSGEPALIDLPNPDDLQAVIVTGSSLLRIFELNGTDVSEIDGGAVTGAADHIVFAKPQGVLEILKVSGSGSVVVTAISGGSSLSETYSMSSGESLSLTLDSGLDSISIQGESIAAAVINRNETDGSLSIINGTAVETTSGQ